MSDVARILKEARDQGRLTAWPFKRPIPPITAPSSRKLRSP